MKPEVKAASASTLPILTPNTENSCSKETYAPTEQLGFTFRMNEQQKQHAAQIQQQLFEQARRQMQQYDLLILDEVMAAINTGMLSVQQVAELIEHRPPQLELVMTGRNPPQQLVELSDYVSQIEKKKHPFDNGIPARDGIER